MSDLKEMLEDLRGIVEPYVQDQEALKHMDENTDFIEDLKINSANLVDIILDIEEKYDIEIDNDSMDKMVDIKSALEVIKSKVNEK